MPGAAEGRRDSPEAGAAGDPASSRPFSPRPERPRERGAPPDDDGTREEDGAGSPPDFAASRSLQDGFPPARARRGGPEGAGRSLESVRSMGAARPIGEARAMGDSVRADGTSFPSARSFSFSLQPSLAPAKGNGGRTPVPESCRSMTGGPRGAAFASARRRAASSARRSCSAAISEAS